MNVSKKSLNRDFFKFDFQKVSHKIEFEKVFPQHRAEIEIFLTNTFFLESK